MTKKEKVWQGPLENCTKCGKHYESHRLGYINVGERSVGVLFCDKQQKEKFKGTK